MNHKHKFTAADKLRILKESETEGVQKTLDKYGLYPATFYYWKKKVFREGEEGLQRSKRRDYNKEIVRLQKENDALKKLVAEKDLELKVKTDLVKKKLADWKSGKR